jgi:hypothetical protein
MSPSVCTDYIFRFIKTKRVEIDPTQVRILLRGPFKSTHAADFLCEKLVKQTNPPGSLNRDIKRFQMEI